MAKSQYGKGEPLTIIYDGQCPFCAGFVALYRVRQNVGGIELLDARVHPEIVTDMRARGYEINDGMVAVWEGNYYYGQEAVSLMAMLSAETGTFAWLNRLLFTSPRVAGTVYPLLVRGRKIVLKMLRRQPIV